jgi:HK97 gp10 family phage protein
MMVVSNARGFDLNEQGVAVGPTKAGFYGSFQEFGTAHHAAQPFARPAFDLTAQQSLQILVAVMWRELARRGISRTIGAPVRVQPGPGGGLL